MKHRRLPRALTLALALAAATFGPLLSSGAALAETSKEGNHAAAENAKESGTAKPESKETKGKAAHGAKSKSKKASASKAGAGHKKTAKAHKPASKAPKAKRSSGRETKPATKRTKAPAKAEDTPTPSGMAAPATTGDTKPASAKHPTKGGAKPGKGDTKPAAAAHPGKGDTKPAVSVSHAKADTKPAAYIADPGPAGHRAASHTSRRSKRPSAKRPAPCVGASVSIDRAGVEADRFPLVDCHNRPLATAIAKVAVLSRPWGSPKSQAAKTPSIDAEVIARLNAIAAKLPGHAISVVGGPSASGKGKSAHEAGRAIDFRVDGVENDKLVEVCRSLPDTGCGYYPNASFIHIDARPKGAGKTFWIDASEPGETPRYVTSWPPK